MPQGWKVAGTDGTSLSFGSARGVTSLPLKVKEALCPGRCGLFVFPLSFQTLMQMVHVSAHHETVLGVSPSLQCLT